MKRAPRLLRLIRTTSPALQAISLFLVALSVFYAHRETSLLARQLKEVRQSNKYIHTFDLLGDLSENGDLSDANFAMVRLINSGAIVTVDDNGNPTIENKSKIPDDISVNDRELVALLNYYELIGTAYDKDTIDRNLVLHVRGGPMSRAYETCEKYIVGRQQLLGAENLYENFRKVVSDFQLQK